MQIINMNARLYDPLLGQFISVDPMADKYPGWGSYVYCANNPLMYVDPTGEWYYDWFGDLIEEEGDNEETLAEFFDEQGIYYEDSDLTELYKTLGDNGMISNTNIIEFLQKGNDIQVYRNLVKYLEANNLNIMLITLVLRQEGFRGSGDVASNQVANSSGNGGWNKGYKRMSSSEFVEMTEFQMNSLNDVSTYSLWSGAALSAVLSKADYKVGLLNILIFTAFAADVSNMDGEITDISAAYRKQCTVDNETILNKTVYVKERKYGGNYAPGPPMRTDKTYYTEDGFELGTLHGW